VVSQTVFYPGRILRAILAENEVSEIMSRIEKRAGVPANPADVEAEQRRRDELAGNGQYQAGVAAAKANELQNAQGMLTAELANLKRATLNRDVNEPGRGAYDRTWNRAVKAAERVALATGKPVDGVPAYLPRPAPRGEDTITIGAPVPTVHEFKGPKGQLPTSGPGSVAWANTAWEIGK
jgi:hypothetical protein